MKLFRHRKQENPEQPGKDRLAKGIAGFIIKMQTGFAGLMNKHAGKFSASTMKAALIIFFVSGTGLSIYFIVAAIQQKGQSKAMKIDRFSIPRYYDKSGDESIQPDFFITKKEHEQMQAFKDYMDSLHHNKTGMHIYDSILLNRPGLLDSVNMLEQIYQQQLQNKK